MSTSLSNEEKKRLSYERQSAVRKAWKEEQARVESGHGTRLWTKEQQKEILERGSVHGYEGHHMKSVSLYPEQAGNPENIQFLSEDEHLYGAHGGDYHNLTNGYYDPYTQTMKEFDGDELKELPTYDLERENEMADARNNYENNIMSKSEQNSANAISISKEETNSNSLSQTR